MAVAKSFMHLPEPFFQNTNSRTTCAKTLFAPLPLQKLTYYQVHKTIQDIAITIPNHGSIIPIQAIAEHLDVCVDEISEQMKILNDLYYIRFADRKNEKICLTTPGRYTIVPGGA
jgi:hypothetical protein